MLRRFVSNRINNTAAACVSVSAAASQSQFRFARILPQGFDFLENPVKELDPHAVGETLPKMTVNITRHDEFIFANDECKACVVPANDGEAGVAPGHEYEIAKLDPGKITVETVSGKTKHFVCSGGFAHINPAGAVDIQCAECVPLEELDNDLAQKELSKAQDAVKATQDEKLKAVHELEVQMLEAVIAALKAPTTS